ncbi:MAG: endonuclease III domain-containing protein [Nitrososphaeraceae archaeon]
MSTIENIIINMEEKLNQETNLPRFTALKELQLEEDGNAFKILIGTILSARSRDENTAKVVRNLFKKYKNIEELAFADINEIKKVIHSIGFYNTKAERIKKVSQIILNKFNGKVPNNMEQLLELPGVGRKTANCVLVYAYNKPAIPVDVHVHRISNRIGIVNTKTPEDTEKELAEKIKKKYWLKINNIFVMYGQNICLPIKPKCKICNLKNYCDFYKSEIE